MKLSVLSLGDADPHTTTPRTKATLHSMSQQQKNTRLFIVTMT